MALKSYNLGIKPIDYVSYSEISNRFISDADIIVDAIFGIGFNGCAKGKYADVINAINDSNAVKICIDVPSGMTSDNGICDGITVKANATVTFATYKPCHLLPPSNELCGKVIVTQIGIPDAAYLVVDPVMHVASTDKVCIALPDRTVNFHKGDCGTAALFCGAKGYSGAAVIAAKSAVRSGAGIVNVIIPESIYPIVGASVHEAVCTVYNDVAEDTVRDDITEHIIATIDRSDIALIGCGLGQSKQTSYTIKEILKNCSVPIVIDADGINCLTDSIELIRQYTNEVIITPHPKEASRLLGCSVADVQKDRLHAVKKLAQITNAVSILKGANTLIALPDGTVYVVTDGNPGMATAGTGDYDFSLTK